MTENLNGTFSYSASEGGQTITAKITNFKLETVLGHHPQSHLEGIISVGMIYMLLESFANGGSSLTGIEDSPRARG